MIVGPPEAAPGGSGTAPGGAGLLGAAPGLLQAAPDRAGPLRTAPGRPQDTEEVGAPGGEHSYLQPRYPPVRVQRDQSTPPA